MIIDSSALLAILNAEPDAEEISLAIEAHDEPRISAATLVEAATAAGSTRQSDLDRLIAESGTRVVSFDADQASMARRGFLNYGRGSGSRARLNFGDCFSYALAKVTGEPLLFKGDDFTHTDIEPALSR